MLQNCFDRDTLQNKSNLIVGPMIRYKIVIIFMRHCWKAISKPVHSIFCFKVVVCYCHLQNLKIIYI